jgi:antitoxin component of MazEF toxin-antitoxin module
MLTRNLFKHGGSLVMCIPSNIADELSLETGQPIQIERTGKQLILTPLTKPNGK